MRVLRVEIAVVSGWVDGSVWFVVTFYSAKSGLSACLGCDDADHVRVKVANLVGYASELPILAPHSKRGRPVRVYRDLEKVT